MRPLPELQQARLDKIRENCTKCPGLKPLGGWIETSPGHGHYCDCMLQVIELTKYFRAYIPEKFIEMTPTDYEFPINPLLEKYMDELGKWSDKGIGLYLYGPNGTGKSFWLSMIAKRACIQNKSVYFCSLEHFLKMIIDSQEDDDIKDDLEFIKNCDLLCIDEIEKVYKPSRELSFAEIIFDDLFRSRSNNKKAVCCTSNLPQKDLQVHGKHLISLFAETMVPVHLENTDFRKNIAEAIRKDILGEK